MDDGVGVLEDPLDPVLGDDDGDGEVVHETGDRGEHVLGARGVQGRGRLVEDDDPGVGGEHRPDGDPLLLATGQLPQGGAAQVGDAQHVERLLDPLAHRRRAESELLHAVGQLLLDGVGDEAGERVLPTTPTRSRGRGRSRACHGRDAHVPGEDAPVKWGTWPVMAPSRVDCPEPVRPTTRTSSPSHAQGHAAQVGRGGALAGHGDAVERDDGAFTTTRTCGCGRGPRSRPRSPAAGEAG